MATPFDQIRNFVGMGSKVPGQLNQGATALAKALQSGVPTPPSNGGTPTPPAGTEHYTRLVTTPAQSIASLVSHDADTVSKTATSDSERVTAIGSGFNKAGASFANDMQTAFNNSQDAASKQFAILTDNISGFAASKSDTVSHYQGVATDRINFANQALSDNGVFGQNAVVSNLELITSTIDSSSATGGKVAAELQATGLELASGNTVLTGGFNNGQSIVTGIVDVLANSTVGQSVGGLGGAVVTGVSDIGSAITEGGISVFEAGRGNFPTDTSTFAHNTVNFLNAVSDAGVGPHGVLTQLGASVETILQGAVTTGQSGIDTAAAITHIVTSSVANPIVPDAFQIPANLVGTLSGQDPSGVFAKIQPEFNNGANQVEAAAGSAGGTISGTAVTVFSTLQGTFQGAPDTFGSTYGQVTTPVETVLHTISSSISSQVPPAGIPPVGLPVGLPV